MNLKGQCHELLAAKQDLIDKGQTVLVENRNLVQRMESSVGIPFTSEDDDAFTNFKQVWSGRDFKHVKRLSGHEDRVSSVDVLGDGGYIVTVSHDRTIKLWSSGFTSEHTMDDD